MKFVRRELSVREDRLFHSIRASFAGIIPCKKKKVPLSETDDGIFYHTNHRLFIFLLPIFRYCLMKKR